MNSTTPYEDLMAAQLDQIPVPDMADAIWSSIEMQLDGGTPPPAPPARKYMGKSGYGLLGIVAVVALLWWAYARHAYKKPIEGGPAMEKVVPVSRGGVGGTASPGVPVPPGAPVAESTMIYKRSGSRGPVNGKKDTIPLNEGPNSTIGADSATKQNLPPPILDSMPSQKDSIQVPGVDSVRITPPPTLPRHKKPRGVKGITNEDYRLSVKKDSVH